MSTANVSSTKLLIQLALCSAFVLLGSHAALSQCTCPETASLIDFEGLDEGATVSSVSSGSGISGPAVAGTVAAALPARQERGNDL